MTHIASIAMKKILSFAFALLCFESLFAQKADSTEVPPTSKFVFDLNFLNNSVYLGRKDSLTVPYLTPGISFIMPSGFYAAANASFLTNESRLDLFTLEAGYDFVKRNFDAGVSAAKYFYNTASVNVAAELSATVTASAGYTFSFIRPSLSSTVSMGSNKPDYTATFGLEHSFVTSDEAFSFTPAFYLNGSTQNYYDAYYSKRRYNKRKNRTTTITAQTVDASKFKLLDYELTASAEYKVKDFAFYFEPAVAFPQNPVTVVVNIKPPIGPAVTKTFTEKLETSFYWTVGMSYHLRLKKRS